MVNRYPYNLDDHPRMSIFSLPLIAGILASCAAACAFLTEHILALAAGKMRLISSAMGMSFLFFVVLKGPQDSTDPVPTRILL